MDKLSSLAAKFSAKIKLAQQSAQAGDIETALKEASLWSVESEVAKLIAAAGIPDSSKIAISIVVKAGPAVTFSVALDPVDAALSAKLAGLISAKYSVPMSKALAQSNLTVVDPVQFVWINF